MTPPHAALKPIQSFSNSQNCTLERFTQFEALSKVLDREALGNLVRLQLSTLSDGTIAVVGMSVEVRCGDECGGEVWG